MDDPLSDDDFSLGLIRDLEFAQILAAIRGDAPLAKVESMVCPCCGARITVEFQADGLGFGLNCAGDPMHVVTYQEIGSPPSWWHERVPEPRVSLFYWRTWKDYADDGTLEMKVSGYELDGSHWTGFCEIPVSHPDHKLWAWIFMQGDRFKSIIEEQDLVAIREEFARTSGAERDKLMP